MSAVRRNFTAIPDNVRQWREYFSGLFFAREFAMSLGGCTTEPSGTARYTVSAGIVTLVIPELTGTSNTTLAFLLSLPSEITPSHDQQCLAPIIDNGVTGVGIVHIGTDTGLTLYRTLDGSGGAAFTNSGTKGIRSIVITYPLD